MNQTLTAARAYLARGLSVFPLVGKAPLTEHGVDDASDDTDIVDRWFAQPRNIAIAIPADTVVLDIDPRNGGQTTLLDWCHDQGAEWLADVPRARTGRGDGGVHYWFRYDGSALVKTIGGVDFLRGNKYVVAPPSVVTNIYKWEIPLPDDLDDLPELPKWLLELATLKTYNERPPKDDARYISGDDPLNEAAHKMTDWPSLLEQHGWEWAGGPTSGDGVRWRHPGSDNQFSATIKHDCLFVYSPNTPFEVTEPGDPHGVTLYRALETLDYKGDRKACIADLRRKGYLPTINKATVDDIIVHAEDAEDADGILDPALVAGDTFVFEESADLEARWGTGHDVLWAAGESLMIVGPPGVGKTTIAHQLVAALLGLRNGYVLGYPVTPAERVLYLAMDRPRQIRRGMRRIFKPEDRYVLSERLVVHRGPLASDLARAPESILNLAQKTGCDVVVVDSLKDAAIKLSDDETGGNVNRAIQLCNATDIDVCVLHHQRKGQDGAKPTKLEDVYGSTWLTAGTGSVVLLWGEAGGDLIELLHLKQPADIIGPLNLEHNHIYGTTAVIDAFSALTYLRNQGTRGATISEAARAQHGKDVATGSGPWKRTQRHLDRLVVQGQARHDPQPGVGKEARYVALGGSLDTLTEAS